MLRLSLLTLLLLPALVSGADPSALSFPPALDSYNDGSSLNLWQILVGRVQQEPLNLLATIIFLLAIVHTFLASHFLRLAHHWRDAHEKKMRSALPSPEIQSVSFKAEIMHFFGEIEAVFGIWVIPLL